RDDDALARGDVRKLLRASGVADLAQDLGALRRGERDGFERRRVDAREAPRHDGQVVHRPTSKGCVGPLATSARSRANSGRSLKLATRAKCSMPHSFATPAKSVSMSYIVSMWSLTKPSGESASAFAPAFPRSSTSACVSGCSHLTGPRPL